jgi:hypothetical protein
VTPGKNPGCASQIRNMTSFYGFPAGMGEETPPALQSVPTSGAKSGLTTGAIAGIAVGATVAVILLVVGCILLWRRHKKRQSANGAGHGNDWPGDTNGAYRETPFMEPFTTQASLGRPASEGGCLAERSLPMRV